MDKNKIVNKVKSKLAQSKNTYTKEDIAVLAKKMKESNPNEIEFLWNDFQEKYRVTRDKIDEIFIDKLKVIYQVDAQSTRHAKSLDNLISELKQRKTWT